MKKIASLLTAILFAAAAAACSAPTQTLGVDAVLPWSTDTTPADAYERAEYTIVKHDDIDDLIVAEGKMTIVLSPAGSDENGSYSRLDINAEMTYTDAAPEAARGKTDTVISECVFIPESLMPITSHKSVTITSGGDYNPSYEIDNNYRDKVSVLTKAGGEPHTLSFGDKTVVGVYDNEMLYYAVRAFNQVAAGGSGSFSLANFYDLHGTDKFSPTGMYFACSASGSEETLFFNGENGMPDFRNGLLDAQGSVTAITASVTMGTGTSQRGTAIDLKFSLTPFTVGEGLTAKKVLLSVKTYEHDLSRGSVRYTTTYSLSSYATEA